MSIGERIRARRKLLGMSLDTLAAKAQISKSWLQAVETRHSNISVSKASDLAVALDWTTDELIKGTAPLSDEDKRFLQRYAQLNARDRNLIAQLVETMWLELQAEKNNAS